MWWWIGGVALYFFVAFGTAYSIGKDASVRWGDLPEWATLFASLACLFWPVTLLDGLLLKTIQAGVNNGKRANAKSANKDT